MTSNQIIEAYKTINNRRQEYGVYHKCLFHIHTPASHDFRFFNDKDEHYYRELSLEEIFEIAQCQELFPGEIFASHEDLPLDDVFENKKEYITYLLIAQKLSLNGVEIAVVADHNTVKGFVKLKKAIKLYNDNRSNSIYTQLFPGVEISCADKNHVVGIFNPAQRLNNSLQLWLDDNIMSEKDGTFHTSYEVLSDIDKVLMGIGYIAHIDTSDTFKPEFLSNAYRQMLFSTRHVAIGLSNIDERWNTIERIKPYNREETAFIWDCDSHSIDEIGTKCFWMKGQRIDFEMIRSALRDFEIALQYEEPKEPTQYILGMSICDDESNFLTSKPQTPPVPNAFDVQFSDSLNCFIGGRGTGKSTVLNILNFSLGQYLPDNAAQGKSALASICMHKSICVFYRYNSADYAISFSAPVKEYFDDDILKSFTAANSFNQKYKYKFTYDRNSVSEYAIQKMISVHRIEKADAGYILVHETDKRRALKSFFTTGYSVNELVYIAGSDRLDNYIRSILFQNKTLSQPPIRDIRSKNGLLSWSNEMEQYLSARSQEVSNIINAYNLTQNGKLRIIYSQSNFLKNEIPFDRLFSNQNSRWYRKWNIAVESVSGYLSALCVHISLPQVIYLFLTDQYLRLIESVSILEFCESMTENMVNAGLTELNATRIMDFMKMLRDNIFSNANIKFWITELKSWVIQTESYGLEFNINNREQSANTKPIYKEVGDLSLGQKVVAMLSFILSYGEYSNDFTPLIIDQPEDNLDNQYIYKNLVKDLRDLKGKRQIIIATHSSTIVTNAKAEQVIVMDSDNKHGWISKTGYPTSPAIIRHIINHMEGGADSFRHKSFIYESVLSK